MNLDFVTSQNASTISKLQTQLDYINKENHRLLEVIEDFKLKCRNSEGFFKENAALYSEIQSLKSQVLQKQTEVEEALRIASIVNREKQVLEERMKFMVDTSEIQKLENLLQQETNAIRGLNVRILGLEQENGELRSLKSAYGSDTRALN